MSWCVYLKQKYFKAYRSVENSRCYLYGYTVLNTYCLKLSYIRNMLPLRSGHFENIFSNGSMGGAIFYLRPPHLRIEVAATCMLLWSQSLLCGRLVLSSTSHSYVLFIILTFARHQVHHYVTKLLGWTIQANHLIPLLKEQMKLFFCVPETSLMKRETLGLDLTTGFHKC